TSSPVSVSEVVYEKAPTVCQIKTDLFPVTCQCLRKTPTK
ncbi:7437_t:CDS:1, partial [Ambispora gerdemannii]